MKTSMRFRSITSLGFLLLLPLLARAQQPVAQCIDRTITATGRTALDLPGRSMEALSLAGITYRTAGVGSLSFTVESGNDTTVKETPVTKITAQTALSTSSPPTSIDIGSVAGSFRHWWVNTGTINAGTLTIHACFNPQPVAKATIGPAGLSAGLAVVTNASKQLASEPIRYADQFAGADIGAKVNACIANASPGATCFIPPIGDQTITTQIVLDRPLTLQFSGADSRIVPGFAGPLIKVTNTANSLLTLEGQAFGYQINDLWITGKPQPPENQVPTGLAVSNVGAAGVTTYYYWVTAVINGVESLFENSIGTTTSNAILDGTNYNTVSWTTVVGGATYKVYRTATNVPPSDVGNWLVGSTFSTSLNDQSNTLTSVTPPYEYTASGVLVEQTDFLVMHNFSCRYLNGYCLHLGDAVGPVRESQFYNLEFFDVGNPIGPVAGLEIQDPNAPADNSNELKFVGIKIINQRSLGLQYISSNVNGPRHIDFIGFQFEGHPTGGVSPLFDAVYIPRAFSTHFESGSCGGLGGYSAGVSSGNACFRFGNGTGGNNISLSNVFINNPAGVGIVQRTGNHLNMENIRIQDSGGASLVIGGLPANSTTITLDANNLSTTCSGCVFNQPVTGDASRLVLTGNNVISAGTYNVSGVAEIFKVNSDFTTANNTNLQNITGLSWTVPSYTALNIPFHCALAYSQAAANVAVAFGIQDVTVAPTNIFATGQMFTSSTAVTEANLPTLSTTTATAIVSATPSAITTAWNATLDGFIEAPSNASTSAINIMVSTANGLDAVTVKRGSYCRIF